MLLNQLKLVFSKFLDTEILVSYQELASGHIYDTYLIETSNHSKYILQKINHGVFKDVPGLINNKVSVSNHIQEKLSYLSELEMSRRVLSFIPTIEGEPFYHEENYGYWNLMVYISESITYETVKEEEIAYEGGKLLGEFLNLTNDFDASKLIEVIPKFHDIPYRYEQLHDALSKANKERVVLVKNIIEEIHNLKDEMHIIQNLKESGKIKIRVTHNDTKISNSLFDTSKKGLCMIDTDTVMPGIVHYDFGECN